MTTHDDDGLVVLDTAQLHDLLVQGAGGSVELARARIADADLIVRLADALTVALIAARQPAGVDPMAWDQANDALVAAGRSPINAPPDHGAAWLRRHREPRS